ncbi:DNA translocase FtsK [bacterium]|nr:DNA translocase FtsK [bacterium]
MFRIRWNILLSLVFGFISVFLGMFLGASLWSFVPSQSSWFFWHSIPIAVTNIGGKIGLYFAGASVYTFGAAAYFLVPLLLWFGYLFFTRALFLKQIERIASGFLLVCNVSVLFQGYGFSFFSGTVHGGLVGGFFTSLLERLLDPQSALIIFHVTFAAFLVLSLRFAGSRVVYRLFKGLFSALSLSTRYVWLPILKCCSYFGKALFNGLVYLTKKVISLLKGDDLKKEDKSILEIEKGVSFDDAVRNIHDDDFWEDGSNGSEEYEKFDLSKKVDEALEVLDQIEKPYKLPNESIFQSENHPRGSEDYEQINKDRAITLEQKLERFGISGKVVSIKAGPVVTLFEYQPDMDSKVSKITALGDDLALALRAMSIRIIAPIPGTAVVGFEVANTSRDNVYFADLVTSEKFDRTDKFLPIVLGKKTDGQEKIIDLASMPHLLIAGSTGSGKSVALNTMLISLLCKMSPEQLKIILIDPKRLEFTSYHDIAHLIFPVVTEPKMSVPVLRWVVKEMERRYECLAEWGVRNIFDYKQMAKKMRQKDELPFIVVAIDELADLMMVAGKDVEDLIIRVAQMARAAGIHLLVATQRPSVDVITGLIKVNFPSRISFKVTSRADSRTILDDCGAEKLLGKGDMLFMGPGGLTIERVHGAYVSDREIEEVVAHIQTQKDAEYLELVQEKSSGADLLDDADLELFEQVLDFLEEIDEVSISLLQRRFRIGYNRSARIIETLENKGLVIPSEGGKARKVVKPSEQQIEQDV